MKNYDGSEVTWIAATAYMPELNVQIKENHSITMLNDVDGTVTVTDFEGKSVDLTCYYLKGQSFRAKMITAVDGCSISDIIAHA